MTEERLLALLSRFQTLTIAVVGDLFLDQWLTVDPALTEPSVETGLDAWQVTESRAMPGAAGTVLNNLRAMGVGRAEAVGFTGEDGNGWLLKTLLARQGIGVSRVLTVPERMTPAYVKPMFRCENGLVEGNRLDIKNREPLPAWAEERIAASVTALAAEADAVIVLDQMTQTETDTGAVTAALRETLAALGQAHPEKILYADSRARIGEFRNVLIKCNHLEAARALGGEMPLAQAMARLRERTGRPVFITLGADGIAVGDGTVVPAARQAGPIDVCGAGDATTAALVSALCAGASPEEAALLGNLAAGVTVRKLGTTGTASPAEMLGLYHEQFEERL